LTVSENDHWDRIWSHSSGGESGDLDQEIFRVLRQGVDFTGRSVLELGCGRGTLGRFALERGAGQVTLLDRSAKALAVARKVLAGRDRVSFVQADVLSLDLGRRFDIVLSSGLLEHFRGEEQIRCLEAHADHAAEQVVIIVPATPHWNEFHCRTGRFRSTYGYERPISIRRMRALFRAAGLTPALMRRFFPLYNVGFYWSLPRTGLPPLDRFLDRKCAKLDAWATKRGIRRWVSAGLRPLERFTGGLLIAVGRPQKDSG